MAVKQAIGFSHGRCLCQAGLGCRRLLFFAARYFGRYGLPGPSGHSPSRSKICRREPRGRQLNRIEQLLAEELDPRTAARAEHLLDEAGDAVGMKSLSENELKNL